MSRFLSTDGTCHQVEADGTKDHIGTYVLVSEAD